MVSHKEVSATLANQLAALDCLPLECDGLTRVISTLMQRDGITHEVCVGSLTVKGVGAIPYHWWVTLPDGCVCDFRAGLWLGASGQVPHGLFNPTPVHEYRAAKHLDLASVNLTAVLFNAIAGQPISDFEPLRYIQTSTTPTAGQAPPA